MTYLLRIKYIYLLFLLPFYTWSENLNGPPQHAILEASIKTLQGHVIYGNQKMQSIVRISYHVNSDYTVDESQIKLKQFGTGKDLSTLKWTVSDADNGFDHNISANASRHIDEINTPLPNYRNIIKYISTENTNSKIQICFELPITKATSGIKNETLKPYTTCQDAAIAEGTVRIRAERPISYSGKDFNILPTNVGFVHHKDDDSNKEKDLEGRLYTLKAGSSIPREMTFTLTGETAFFPDKPTAEDTDQAFLMKILHVTGNSDEEKNKEVSHLVSTLLLPQEETEKEFNLLNIAWDYREGPLSYKIQSQSVSKYKPIFHFWHSKYYRQTYLDNDFRCKKRSDGKNADCKFIDPNNNNKITSSERSLSDFPPPQDKLNKKITLVDNFGTKHTLTLLYGTGDQKAEPTVI